ncbi:uncharacterized protein LOC134279932, partial [Saccostrea cucullata]|uniref:uncharacterized protein LOC134279932 n=1 Tax=Saccostrea cuccullata TaxID=36930 RepID=UPI002ED49972
MNKGKKKLTLYDTEFEKYESATSITANRSPVDIVGSVQSLYRAKVVNVTCKPEMGARTKDAHLFFKQKVKENIGFRMEWRSSVNKTKGIFNIIESEAKDKMFGSSNVRWQRKSDKFVPSFFISALGNRNVQATVTKSSSKSFVTVYLVLDRCDPIPGVFTCENAVTLKDSKSISIKASFIFNGKTSRCTPKKPSGGSYTYDKLSEEYSKFLAESFNREGIKTINPIKWLNYAVCCFNITLGGC